MNKILQFLGGSFFKEIEGILDTVITTDEERISAKNKIYQLILGHSETIAKLQASIINSEANGNFLQRSWRPILMLSFGFVILYTKFFAPAFGLPSEELDEEFWELLRIGMGGYIVGRSAEKITRNILENIDISKFKKQK